MRPLFGITVDNKQNTASSGTYECAIAYSKSIAAAGGIPILLPHEVDCAPETIARLDGLVLTGGVDPDTTEFGTPMHPKARAMDPIRQRFELALLRLASKHKPHMPILGVCLGMQLMALAADGALDQYMPDTLATATDHVDNQPHEVSVTAPCPLLGDVGTTGRVTSHHQQAVSDAGRMQVVARSHDGVIEAISDPTRRCVVGLQWHPERTTGQTSQPGPAHPSAAFGQEVFDRLVAVASHPKSTDPPPASRP